MRGSFQSVQNQSAMSPAMQVTVRHGCILFSAAFQAAQKANYVKILADSRFHRLAFLFTSWQGEGAFTLSCDSTKNKPQKIVSCASLFKMHPWIVPGKYEAVQDYRKYWIINVSETA